MNGPHPPFAPRCIAITRPRSFCVSASAVRISSRPSGTHTRSVTRMSECRRSLLAMCSPRLPRHVEPEGAPEVVDGDVVDVRRLADVVPGVAQVGAVAGGGLQRVTRSLPRILVPRDWTGEQALAAVGFRRNVAQGIWQVHGEATVHALDDRPRSNPAWGYVDDDHEANAGHHVDLHDKDIPF